VKFERAPIFVLLFLAVNPHYKNTKKYGTVMPKKDFPFVVVVLSPAAFTSGPGN